GLPDQSQSRTEESGDHQCNGHGKYTQLLSLPPRRTECHPKISTWGLDSRCALDLTGANAQRRAQTACAFSLAWAVTATGIRNSGKGQGINDPGRLQLARYSQHSGRGRQVLRLLLARQGGKDDRRCQPPA